MTRGKDEHRHPHTVTPGGDGASELTREGAPAGRHEPPDERAGRA
jgi:hypothetical protein